MWLLEELRWHLPKVVDEPDGGIPRQRIIDRFEVNAALVEQMMEDVVGLDGFWSCLLVAENQIDPLMQME